MVQNQLRVVVMDGRGRTVRADRLRRWLVEVAPRSARGELSLVLVSDRKMRALNLQFRGVARATDVLSFPLLGDKGSRVLRSVGERYLGDVVIATGVAARQARNAGHRLGNELRRLALHGLLHLLGYDHERDNGEMARLELKLRRRGGIQ
ncbi:MAG: rRNA maturation RNase YbeY [Acidobacteriota bacterium]|nr:rRNA maturation RNase YbeY [Acidobacteriota bacterium]